MRPGRPVTDAQIFDATFLKPEPLDGHWPRPDLYRKPEKSRPLTGVYKFRSKRTGTVERKDGSKKRTNIFKIAWTLSGDAGPLASMTHGVPTNRTENYHLMYLTRGHMRTFSHDMLGMGESSMVMMDDTDDYKWASDLDYLEAIFFGDARNEPLFRDDSGPFARADRVLWIGKDWGGAHAFLMAAKYPLRSAGLVLIDPIFGPSYPVSEIQAIGRMSALLPLLEKIAEQNMEMGEALKGIAMGAFDQTLVQIYKTMVHLPGKAWDQWTLRDVKGTYVDADYERLPPNRDTPFANSMTLRLRPWAIAVLAQRASILAPNLLWNKHAGKNPEGAPFAAIEDETCAIWGEEDDMMSPNAVFRLSYMLPNARVAIHMLKGAGHYADRDQPEKVASIILNFIMRVHGVRALADVFLGFGGRWKGDETELIGNLRDLYGFK